MSSNNIDNNSQKWRALSNAFDYYSNLFKENRVCEIEN